MDVTTKLLSGGDAIALGQRSVDELYPPTRDIQAALKNFPGLPADYQGLPKITYWVDLLNAKNASDVLTEDEARQLGSDIEKAM